MEHTASCSPCCSSKLHILPDKRQSEQLTTEKATTVAQPPNSLADLESVMLPATYGQSPQDEQSSSYNQVNGDHNSAPPHPFNEVPCAYGALTELSQQTRTNLDDQGSLSSTYSSSVYSERSSIWASRNTEDCSQNPLENSILIPKPLHIFKGVRPTPVEGTIEPNKLSFLLDRSPNTTGTTSPPLTPSQHDATLPDISQSTNRNANLDQSSPLRTLHPPIEATSKSPDEICLAEESEDALLREITSYPMVHKSPDRSLTTPPHAQHGLLLVSKKAAKVLGLDGPGSQCASPITPSTPVFSENFKDRTNLDPASSSPHSLRKFASKISLGARKKSPKIMDFTNPGLDPMPDHVGRATIIGGMETVTPDPPRTSNLSTRNNLHNIAEEHVKIPGSFHVPSPPAKGSISKRRGFRPLSVHTGKAFDPFDEKPIVIKRKNGLEREPGDSNSLRSGTLEADFATLASSKPLDLRSHPMFQADPFSSKSVSPLLKTTSSPEEIRKISHDGREGCNSITNSSGSKSSSSSKNKLLFNTQIKHPRKEANTDSSDLRYGGSPIPRKREVTGYGTNEIVPQTRASASVSPATDPDKNSNDFETVTKWPSKSSSRRETSGTESENVSFSWSLKSPATRSMTTPTESLFEDGTEQRRSRGLSNWFRQLEINKEMKSDKRKTSAKQPLDLRAQSEAQREVEISYLRRVLNAPSPKYNKGDMFPQHPNTGGSWNSRNLKCTTCLDHVCECCGRTCCSFKRAYLAAENPLSSPQIKDEAAELLERINRLFPYGREIPTFIQCTHGGGCGRLVCPECIGRCPLSHCEDTQCKKCKKDPWAVCDFHSQEEIRFGRKGLSVAEASETLKD